MSPSPAKSQSQSKGLSVESIVDAALAISEAEGYEAISMRRLADEFGVTAMALYGYVETKHHLLELVADRYMSDLDLAEDAPDWEARLNRIFASFHDLLVERPVLAHVLTSQRVDAPAAYRMSEVALGILRDHGFEDEAAVELVRVLASFTVGMAVSQRPRSPSKSEEKMRVRSLREAGDEYPNLSAVAEYYVPWPEEVFDHGLEQLIRAYARDRSPTKRRKTQ